MRNQIAKSIVVLSLTGAGMLATSAAASADIGYGGSTVTGKGASGGQCATVYTGRYQYDQKNGTTETSLAEVDFNGVSACK